ncbi:DeoR/GlpR family DNA-binding transcription regulator [Levilactobacillus brevis]|uniref:DeoR/GlpR family DNA-binding transcription regulator n=1 Tax=Levilactobacillus hammesii TaxID=267633 RepID=A0A921JXM4_9LACO|nr:DeoR/GlpR family DNA-binding transcription regulator [Levilactobacillus brevis]HJE86997.1 DeoR/GlpR family DNA-binding transcription regulator [Levilactobacillus hammesii]
MHQAERLNRILTELMRHHSLTLREIMALTGTSRDTARRDIVKLTANDEVTRNYGGISLPNSFNRIDDFLTRQRDLPDVKRQLGLAAAKLVTTQQRLFFDISTTISLIPAALTVTSKVLAVTNSLDIADQLLRKTSARTRVLGGQYLPERRGTMDTAALHDLFGFTFELTFLSAAGVTSAGIFYAYQEDVAFKQQLRDQSQELALVVDHTRLGVAHNYRALRLNQIDYLITDGPVPPGLMTALQASRVIIKMTTEEIDHD